MGEEADRVADLAASFATGPIPPEFDDDPLPLHPFTCGGQMNGCRLCEQEPIMSTEADDIIDNNGHGFDHAPDDEPGTAPVNSATSAAIGAATAADAAVNLTKRVQAALGRAGHLPCNYSEFASLTTDQDQLAASCGCGFLAPADDLIDGKRTLTSAEVATRPGNTVTVHGADPIARTAALIPAGAHYTPEMLEANILDVLERLERGGAFERLTIEQAAEAETAYTIAYARAFNAQQGAVEVRAQAAIEATEDSLRARDEARMICKAVKASMHNLRSVLSGYQSVNASVRESYRNANMQQKR
jgi:hypothetical protein